MSEVADYSSAVVSGKPYIRLKFCTAAPLAPLIRLSSALIEQHAAADDAGRDVDEVRVGRVLRRRQVVDDADERLAGVELAQAARGRLASVSGRVGRA